MILQDGYWGFGDDAMTGCKPCDCDMGGAEHNTCDRITGQCTCRPHVTGRRCDEPIRGYFSPELDYILLEAENAEITGVQPIYNISVCRICSRCNLTVIHLTR